jgi:hypothetical protein
MPVNTFRFHDAAIIPNIQITHPEEVAAARIESGLPVEPADVDALIDTGASITIIDEKIPRDLDLVFTGYMPMRTVSGVISAPVYFARVIFSWGYGIDLRLAGIAIPDDRFKCIIGREILGEWHLTYNGPETFFTVCQ